MKVLIVCQHYKPEPFNTSEVAEGLASRGYDIIVLTALPNCPEGIVYDEYRHGRHRDEEIEGVRVIRVPIVARGENLEGLNKLRRVANYVSFPFMCRLTGAAADDRYDCVVCVQFSPVLMALPALRIAKEQRIPCLIWSFDLWPEDMLTGGMSRAGVPYRIMRFVSKRIYGAADMVAVTSPGFPRYFEEELGICGLKTAWLPQFAEEMFEEPIAGIGSPPADETVFTFAGNVGGNQSVETIIEAAALLADERVRVRIAGSGSRLEACKRLAEKLGVGNVEFLGRLPLEKMPGLYAASDAMLLTLAKPEGDSLVPVYTIPRKLQSYIAAGKPVICAADGVVAEIVERERCGLACRAEDPVVLAQTMLAFTRSDGRERTAMRKSAARLYRERFSRGRFFGDLESILCDLTERN